MLVIMVLQSTCDNGATEHMFHLSLRCYRTSFAFGRTMRQSTRCLRIRGALQRAVLLNMRRFRRRFLNMPTKAD